MKNCIPIACTLSESALAERTQVVSQELFAQSLGITELADGYELQFSGDDAWLRKLTEFVAFERKCCAFLHFELEFPPNQGPVLLRLRGDMGTKQFLQGILQPVLTG